MSRKVFSIVLLLFFFQSSSFDPAIAVVKAGAKCSKVGDIAVVSKSTFKCSKSGKKLIWRLFQVVINPVIKNSSETIAFEIWQKYQVNKKSNRELNYLFSPTSQKNSPVIEKIIIDTEASWNYWSNYGFLDPSRIKIVFTTEQDIQWWNNYKITNSLNCQNSCNEMFTNFEQQPYTGSVYYSNISDDSHSNLTIFYFISSTLKNEGDIYMAEIMASHEFAHVVQMELNPGLVRYLQPCWFIEGFARFYERSMHYADKYPRNISFSSLQKGEIKYFERRVREVTNLSPLGSWKVSEYLNFIMESSNLNSFNCKEINYGYKIGWVISEKYYADFGELKFIELLKNTFLYKDWEKAFNVTNGVSQADWMSSSGIPYLLEIVQRN